MKILLVYVNNISEGYLPVGLASLAGAIRDAGHKVDLFDTSFYKTNRHTDRELREKYLEFKKVNLESHGFGAGEEQLYEDWINKIKEFNPEIIGISATSTEFPSARILMEKAKKEFPGIPIIAGGTHANVAPEKVIGEKAVDMLCVGEGEEAIVELLDRMKDNKDYSDVKNIWVKKNGGIIRNESRRLLEDLDKLPFPYWELFDKRHFIRPFEGKVRKYGFFEFGRGCVYSCTYCANRHMQKLYAGKGKYHREKSVERMTKEILMCKEKIEIDHIFFIDENFLIIDEKKLKEFADRYQKEINLTSMIMARSETINPEKIEIIKKMRCVMVMMGLESGSKRIREEICKRYVKEEDLFNAVRLLKEAGIPSSIYNMIGFPTETREEVFETIEANRALKPYRMTIKILCPFEGTEVRKIAIEKGYMGDINDITKMYYEDTCLNMPQLPPEEIRGLRKTFPLYVLFPKIIWPLIKLCEGEDEFSNRLYKEFSNIYWEAKEECKGEEH